MSKNRTTRTSKQKFNVVVELLQWRKTQAQITSEYWVHPSQQKTWKDEFMSGWTSIFDRKKDKKEKEQKKEVEKLHKIIGQYAVEVDWLQKKIGWL